jgi:predicted Zn-dependent protease
MKNLLQLIAVCALVSCTHCAVNAGLFDDLVSGAADVANQATGGHLPAGSTRAIAKTGSALFKAAEGITDEQEYYLGRSVAVNLLDMFGYYDNPELQKYLTEVGKTVLCASGTPETFGGYHFAVLNSEEVNAMAVPGGTIFVTVGTLRLITSEDQLAAVLAHEIAHVKLKHGVGTIKSSRMSNLASVVASEAGNYAVRQYTDVDIGNLKDIMEGAIGDITKELVTNGYSRGKELEADRMAIEIIATTGYNPAALRQFLVAMANKKTGDISGGWFKTHPKASDRLSQIDKVLARMKAVGATNDARTARFAAEKEKAIR